MASGLNGQRFAFHGYLAQEKSERIRNIQALEKESRQKQMTQMFIETPYRNVPMFADLVNALAANTMLCVAADLTGPNERVTTLPVGSWKQKEAHIEKLPTLFLFLAK
jgi:16S rRNA (cytidine1402-2'-O)-methyltransferase